MLKFNFLHIFHIKHFKKFSPNVWDEFLFVSSRFDVLAYGTYILMYEKSQYKRYKKCLPILPYTNLVL